MKEQNFISVSKGDVVIIQCDFGENQEPREAEVLSVIKRYEHINMGQTKMAPLVTVRLKDTGEERSYDNGLVKSVVVRSKIIWPPENIYASDAGREIRLVKIGRSRWEGSLHALAFAAFSKLPFEIDREIHYERLTALYRRQRAGLIQTRTLPGGTYILYTVKADAFCKWIRKNWTRIIKTPKEVDAENTAFNTSMEQAYWADVEMDMLNDLEEEERLDGMSLENDYWEREDHFDLMMEAADTELAFAPFLPPLDPYMEDNNPFYREDPS